MHKGVFPSNINKGFEETLSAFTHHFPRKFSLWARGLIRKLTQMGNKLGLARRRAGGQSRAGAGTHKLTSKSPLL